MRINKREFQFLRETLDGEIKVFESNRLTYGLVRIGKLSDFSEKEIELMRKNKNPFAGKTLKCKSEDCKGRVKKRTCGGYEHCSNCMVEFDTRFEE